MASADGQTPNSIVAKLRAEPYGFGFYAAVRALQSCFPAQPRIGYSRSPAQDPVRFAQNPALDFAPSTLEAVRADGPRPPVVYSRHFGLFGPQGPLPLAWTEYARDRIRHGDATFTAFCNVFHHRLLSFFFRAWADASKTVDLDRLEDQRWADFLGSLLGIGMDSLQGRSSVPDRALLYFSGRLVQQARNAEGLEAIIHQYFGVPTEVQTFVGRWLQLPQNHACRLGASRETTALGSSVIVGARVWTCQMHFRLRLGPMKLSQFERLLPTGSSFQRLSDWIRHYLNSQFSWDAQFVLAKEQVPGTQLGRAGRLGWTTWLKTQPFLQDAEDLILQGNN